MRRQSEFTSVPFTLGRSAHRTAIAGYQTYPFAASSGAAPQRAMTRRRKPLLPHVMRWGIDDAPNHELPARCPEMETEGVMCASAFGGFQDADTE